MIAKGSWLCSCSRNPIHIWLMLSVWYWCTLQAVLLKLALPSGDCPCILWSHTLLFSPSIATYGREPGLHVLHREFLRTLSCALWMLIFLHYSSSDSSANSYRASESMHRLSTNAVDVRCFWSLLNMSFSLPCASADSKEREHGNSSRPLSLHGY